MKRILILAAMFSATLVFTACGGGNSRNKQAARTETTATEVAEVDAILAQAETLVGQEVSVEGICTHICSHGGRKLFLMGTDDKQVIRVEAGEKIGSFGPECANSLVRIKGRLVEDRIDEAYLAEWEQELKDQTVEQHGNGEAGCSAEQQAHGETVANSEEKRIAAFRARIADRKAKEGKEYLSFYHIDGDSYEIQK